MKPKKYTYLFVLQADYGHGHGWEDIAAEEIEKGLSGKAYRAIRQTRREYLDNAPQYAYKIIRRREKAEAVPAATPA